MIIPEDETVATILIKWDIQKKVTFTQTSHCKVIPQRSSWGTKQKLIDMNLNLSLPYI